MLLSRLADVATAVANAKAKEDCPGNSEGLDTCICLSATAALLIGFLAFAPAAAVSACTGRHGQTAASPKEAFE